MNGDRIGNGGNLLPRRYLQFRSTQGVVLPNWLESRHDGWLRAVIEAFEACDGIAASELENRGGRAIEVARENGVGEVAARGVWHVLRRWMTTVVDAPIAPRKLRAELLLAPTADRPALARTIAERHGSDVEGLRNWLYADLAGARIVRPTNLPAPNLLRAHYNMELAQGLIARCTLLSVRVPENLRAIVRIAKLRGLLLRIDQDGSTLRASGPMALFRHTVKYANALATFMPALIAMPSWSLEGEIVLSNGVERLTFDSTAPLPREWVLPRRTDSALEAKLLRDLLRLNTRWSVKREALVLTSGRELFFPDFVLERDRVRVAVEVVGFWTPEYLSRKLEQLKHITHPLVVCVDDSLACDPAQLPNAHVLRFKRTVDAPALLAAAEAAVHGSIGRA